MVACAQTDKNIQEILKSKTWRWGEGSELYFGLTFTRDSIISISNGTEKHNYKGFNGQSSYYLSDINDAKFIESKIGKKQSGMHLVNKNLSTLKIISVTDDKVTRGNINNNDGEGIIIYNAIDQLLIL